MFLNVFKNKKSTKSTRLYISEKYNKIIISPYYYNKAGIYYEQEECSVFDLNISNEKLGIEIINALNKFSYKDKNLVDCKLTDWPAFKYSKLKTVKSFEENYLIFSIKDENNCLSFVLLYPSKSKLGGKEVLKIPCNSEKDDIGKKIIEIYRILHKMTYEEVEKMTINI
jgi:hypothetical protein